MISDTFNDRLIALKPVLARQAQILTKDRDEALDLLQETLYKALKYKWRYANEVNLGGWVYTIMRNTFLNQKKRECLVRFRSLDETPHLVNSVRYSQENATADINRKDIEKAIALLPESIRKPFVMSVSGFQYDEIALEMGIPMGTVKSRIFRAREVLSESLRDPVLS